MLGYLAKPELHRVLMATDIFLAPFVDASGSASLSQAFTYNRPIIASDIPTLVELKELGFGIVLFQSGNSADLTDKLRQLLSNPEQQRHLTEMTERAIRNHGYDSFAAYLKSLYSRSFGT